ncbi:endonuclease domain-containing protein [bacterium]|nr:endonuclease domain-containing protein [bacterium]
MPRWEDIPQQNWSRSRELRRAMTEAEERLWQCIRAGKIGTRVRRQMPIGPFIADFVLTEFKLIIEVDGDSHKERVAYDGERMDWLEAHGYKVARYTNTDVMQKLEWVLEDIRERITPP